MKFIKILMKDSKDSGFLLYPGASENFPYAGFCLLRKEDGDIYYPSKLDDAGNGKFWPSPLEFGDCRFPFSRDDFEVVSEMEANGRMVEILIEISLIIEWFSKIFEDDENLHKEKKMRITGKVVAQYISLFISEVKLKGFFYNSKFDVNPN